MLPVSPYRRRDRLKKKEGGEKRGGRVRYVIVIMTEEGKKRAKLTSPWRGTTLALDCASTAPAEKRKGGKQKKTREGGGAISCESR